MTTRVLILWAKHSATNLGIRVLASGTARLCEMAFPDNDIDFHDHDTPGTPLSKEAMLRDIGRRDGYEKQLFREYDVVLDTTSGDSFTDIYGVRRLTVMSYAHRAAIRSGTPLVLAPITIGPFNTRYGRYLARASLKGATRVYARDSESARYATGLGRRPNCTASDLVFALPTLPPPDKRVGVLLNVSGLLWRPNPHVSFKDYQRHVVDTVRSLSASGTPVTMFPHVLRSTLSREDDVTAVEEAAEILRDDAAVFFPTSLDELRSELNCAAAVVGARMHACLNALSLGTPAFAWAYSRKFAPLLRDLGWSAYTDLRTDDRVAENTQAFVSDVDHWTESAPMVRQRAILALSEVAQDLSTVIRDRDYE